MNPQVLGFRVMGLQLGLPTSLLVEVFVRLKHWPLYGGFPKLGLPFWGVPIIRIIKILGSILRSPYFGKLPIWALDPEVLI